MTANRNMKSLSWVLVHFEVRAVPFSFTPGLSQVTTQGTEGPSRFNGLQSKPLETVRGRVRFVPPGSSQV